MRAFLRRTFGTTARDAVVEAALTRQALSCGSAAPATLLEVLSRSVASTAAASGASTRADDAAEGVAVRAAWTLGAQLSREAAALVPQTFPLDDAAGDDDDGSEREMAALASVPASAVAEAFDGRGGDDAHGALLASRWSAEHGRRFAACDEALALVFASLRLQVSAAQRHINSPAMLGDELKRSKKAQRALQRRVDKQARTRAKAKASHVGGAAAAGSGAAALAADEWPLLDGSALADDRFLFGDQSHGAVVACEALERAEDPVTRARRADVAANLEMVSALVERRACLSHAHAVLYPWLMSWLHHRQSDLVQVRRRREERERGRGSRAL